MKIHTETKYDNLIFCFSIRNDNIHRKGEAGLVLLLHGKLRKICLELRKIPKKGMILLLEFATPLSNRAVNYVFSSNRDVGVSSPSPYTKKSIDNVMATTKTNLNEWVTVKSNVKEDFKKFHDLDLDELDGLAVMADTDNSKMKSIAYFQNIYFSAN